MNNTIKPINGPSTQHIFLDFKRQLHVSAIKGSHNQAIYKIKYKSNKIERRLSKRQSSEPSLIRITAIKKLPRTFQLQVAIQELY